MTKKLTQEEMEKKKEKAIRNREWAVARKASLDKILGFLDEMRKGEEGLPEEIAEAAMVFNKRGKAGSKVAVRGIKHSVLEYMKENGHMHEDDLFLKFKLGRVEARTMFNSFLKVEPDKRIWIKFDRETGVYTFIHEGAEAPENWDGYLPTGYSIDNQKDQEDQEDEDQEDEYDEDQEDEYDEDQEEMSIDDIE